MLLVATETFEINSFVVHILASTNKSSSLLVAAFLPSVIIEEAAKFGSLYRDKRFGQSRGRPKQRVGQRSADWEPDPCCWPVIVRRGEGHRASLIW